MAVLVDTTVVLDLLGKREPWAKDASDLLFLAAEGKAHLYLTGSTVTDLYYLMHKSVFHNEAKSREVLATLLDFFSVVEVGFAECCIALTSNTKDYEDAVLIETARRAGVEFIITRNAKDYTDSPVPVLTPGEYLSRLVA
jgi:predicted nucleic acid-binding protein